MLGRCLYIVLFFTALLLGCDSNDSGLVDDEIAGIRMLPESVTMEPGDQAQFSIVAVTESGEEIEDHDFDLRWWSSDTEVFTVSENGIAVANEPGEAWCIAEVEALQKYTGVRFVGRDSAGVTVLF